MADEAYVKEVAAASGLAEKPMAIVATDRHGKRKRYLSCNDDDLKQSEVLERLDYLLRESGLVIPNTRMEPWFGVINPPLSGLTTYRSLFNPRQLLAVMMCVEHLRGSFDSMGRAGIDLDRRIGILLLTSTLLDQLADWNCSLATWIPQGEKVGHALAGPGIGMAWDFVEINPLFPGAGRLEGSGTLKPKLERVVAALESVCVLGAPAAVQRSDAGSLPWEDASFDYVITDPPYYWNLPYSHLSDCVYVWLRLVLGDILPEHFATETTPKRREAIASAVRDGPEARATYEDLMTRAFNEANRVLKSGGSFLCVYAHKTTAGWATLVESMRKAGFVVVEAWPVEMEKRGRRIAIDSAALK